MTGRPELNFKCVPPGFEVNKDTWGSPLSDYPENTIYINKITFRYGENYCYAQIWWDGGLWFGINPRAAAMTRTEMHHYNTHIHKFATFEEAVSTLLTLKKLGL